MTIIIWPSDDTPRVMCDNCGRCLIGDDNGNAPLVFSRARLLSVLLHCCPRRKV